MKRLFTLLLCCATVASAQDKALSDLTLEPPVINSSPGPEYDDQVRPGNMIIGIDRTPKGRLWAAWVGNGDSPNGFFMLATSDDDGKTWSKPRVVIDPQDGELNGVRYERRALVGNLWTDPLGRLWCFFDQSLGYFDGRCGDWYIRCDDPDATEPKWTEPVRFADGCTLNKPTVLSNGDWLLPVSLWTRDRIGGPGTNKDAHKDLDAFRMANVFASTDQGKTWTRRSGVAFPKTNFDEHMIVERKDGSLWMLARTADGISESFSTDKGHTWTEPMLSPTIANLSARFFIRRLASGKLLLVKNGPINVKLPRRSNMKAFLSDDDGKTWGRGLLIDDRSEVSYPDGFQAPDGTIHILYDWNRHTDAEILHVKFTEADFEARTKLTPTLVNKAHSPRKPKSISPDPKWTAQAEKDAQQDFKSIPYDGVSPNKMVCDTTLRELPDGTWILFFLAGGDTEPSPLNYTGVTRCRDQGKTWTPLEAFDVGFPREGKTIGQGPTELMILGDRATLFFSTHSKHWANDWRSWYLHSDDSFKTWSKPSEVPGRLKIRTFIRNHIVCQDGRIMVPFQHYIGPDDEKDKEPLDRAFTNPRNGVLISKDSGKTWSEHGNIRLTPDSRYFGWAEPSIVELGDGRVVMIIRADKLGGMLYKAESKDGGLTWPEFASLTSIPNPGSKATLYSLGGDTVALLHNPNSKHRSPMALWISFDGMKSWPYQRVLQAESVDGPKGRMNYPDGFLSKDKQWLHFAFDDNRHRAVHYSAKLPPLPGKSASADYLKTVRAYADAMLDHGRDKFGSESTPLFATVLDRKTYQIPEGKVSDLVRARVPQENKSIANPHYDQNLLQVLHALTKITGEPRYAAEAARTIEYFVKHCQEPRFGFYTWGEHVGWDLTTESLGGFPQDKPDYAVHEFWRPWIYWEPSFTMAPEQCHRFAQALWKHQLDWTKPGIAWSRHAQLLSKVPSRRGYEFPRHGGFYIATWAHAYHHTKDPEMLKAVEAVTDYYIASQHPQTGAIPHCSLIPEWFRPESTVSLAVNLEEAAPFMPEPTARKMRALASSIDKAFLNLPHEPGPGGKGLVLTATLDLKPTDIYLLESGKWTTTPPADNVYPPRHKAYTEGWLSAYVGPVPHSTMIGYCIARHRQTKDDGYGKLILRTADHYLASSPPDADEKSAIDTGTIGRIICLMNHAYRISRDEKYLNRAEWFANWAQERFWGDGLPLPLPSFPSSEKQNFYSASSRCDTLAMSMLEAWLLRNQPKSKIEFAYTDL
jgi:predicted neuraminidase